MKKINVIDLDHTLINYDSFRELVKLELYKLNIYVLAITLLRLIRFISLNSFKVKIIKFYEKKYNEDFFINFSKVIYGRIDKNILTIINQETDENTTNVLLSASPNIYVKYLVDLLSWEGSGSFFENSTFYHMHGANKVNWILKNYNKKEFKYNFSISDGDIQLLKLFKKSKLMRK